MSKIHNENEVKTRPGWLTFERAVAIVTGLAAVVSFCFNVYLNIELKTMEQAHAKNMLAAQTELAERKKYLERINDLTEQLTKEVGQFADYSTEAIDFEARDKIVDILIGQLWAVHNLNTDNNPKTAQIIAEYKSSLDAVRYSFQALTSKGQMGEIYKRIDRLFQVQDELVDHVRNKPLV
ncbi:hypothetical protein TDB9533_03558 [Thalassocella blandensis]|nr:hypothetical protein TDB9533_03558 [Thalassocella blandensis]